MISTRKESVLLVEKDPEIHDLIANQALGPLGYRVLDADDAGQAIREAIDHAPDVIIANINLPGLSGKDLLVALSSQGIDSPVIVVADQGMEEEIIRSFRLGAVDYLSWPFQESEVVTTVERVLERVRTLRERAELAEEVRKTNQELKQRVKELTTLFRIGKAVTSVTSQRELFQNIIDSSMYVTNADRGWLLLRDETRKKFLLAAHRNLPDTIASRLNSPWDDGISSLVAVSGETLAVHGPALNRFQVSRLGKSIVIIPINVNNETPGILVLMRKENLPFSKSTRTLLEAVSDYGSISLVNVRLFEALEERAYSLGQAVGIARHREQVKTELLKSVSQELRPPVNDLEKHIKILEEQFPGVLNKRAEKEIALIDEIIAEIHYIIDAVTTLQEAVVHHTPRKTDLKEIIQEVITRSQAIAREKGITLHAELAVEDIHAFAAPEKIRNILDILLSNAIKFNQEEGEITVFAARNRSGAPVISIHDTGIGIPPPEIKHLFDPFHREKDLSNRKKGGAGIGLALANKLALSQGGRIDVESSPGEGTTFRIILQSPNQQPPG